MRLSREEKTLLLPASVRHDRSRLEFTFDLSNVDVLSVSCNNIQGITSYYMLNVDGWWITMNVCKLNMPS